MAILILIAFIAISITIDALVRYNRKRKLQNSVSGEVSHRVFNESSVCVPLGIYFDKSHTWAFMEKNGHVKVGIDDFLLHVTGPLNRVKMKNPGDSVQKGEPFLSIIKDGKQLNINSPISGVVKSNNFRLLEEATLINNSPFNEGWIYSVEPTNWMRETQFMLMSERYKDWLKNEFSRLKDFFATTLLPINLEFMPVAYQDGGELLDNVLADSGPEVWEEFQLKFINTSK